MNTSSKLTITGALAIAMSASAQTAVVDLTASNEQPEPGETVTITLSADFTLNGAGPGVFGAAGLYGFGGDILATGDANGTAAAPTVNTDLGFGLTASAPNAGAIVRAAAGRGLEGGLPMSPTDLMSFDVAIASDAPAGSSLTLTFDGALVLVLDSSLTTYATDPGMNQQALAPASVTLTVQGGGCNNADLAEPFNILDLGDISAFVGGFTTRDPIADLAAPFGIFDLADISLFVGDFTSGCP